MRDGWVETSLGEVADVIDPHPSHRAPAVDENGIPFIGIGDLRKTGDIDFAKARRVSRDILEEHKSRYDRSEFLIGLGRVASIGMVVRLPDENIEYVVSPTLAVIKAREVMGQFLFYLLEGPHSQEQFQRFKKGSTRESVGMQILRKIKVQVPPLPEQKRIVDLISSVDTYIEVLQQQLESAKRSRNAVLYELLSTGGDDWVEHKLIDMFEIYQPQTIAKSLMSEDGEFIVFGANGPIGRYHEFNHDEPEVVVTCRGATCGTVNMTPPKTWITGNAMVVSPKTSEVSKEFLYWALVSGVDIQSVISGSAQPQITREGLAPVKIKIPPLSRQVEIVDLISGFELNISYLEESVHKTKTLRSGLMSDLLSGEHEIPTSYDKVMGAA